MFVQRMNPGASAERVHRRISPKAFYPAVAVDPLRKEPRFQEIVSSGYWVIGAA